MSNAVIRWVAIQHDKNKSYCYSIFKIIDRITYSTLANNKMVSHFNIQLITGFIIDYVNNELLRLTCDRILVCH